MREEAKQGGDTHTFIVGTLMYCGYAGECDGRTILDLKWPHQRSRNIKVFVIEQNEG